MLHVCKYDSANIVLKFGRVLNWTLTVIAVLLGASGCMAVPILAANQGVSHLAMPCGSVGLAQRRCESLTLEGVKRNYRMYVPAKVSAPAPLLFVLHGAFRDSAEMEAATGGGLDRRAEEIGALVVYPDSHGIGWNFGRDESEETAGKESIDDVGFLRALVAKIGEQHAIDSERVFVAGFSSGGLMTLRLACEATDLFRGFVAVSAVFTDKLAQKCHPIVARPVALIEGTGDPIMSYTPGRVGTLGLAGHGIGADATFSDFRAIAGCTGVETGPLPPEGPNSPTNVIVHRATGCPDGLAVVLFEIRGGLHIWPGGVPESPSLASRIRPQPQFDANAYLWQFLGLQTGRSQPQVSQANGARQ